MKPPLFEYVKASSVDQALDALARFGGDARLLAGGQSLVPMLNLRILKPAGVVDLNGVSGLDGIRADGQSIRIGALVRYVMLEDSPLIRLRLPLLAEAVVRVADRQVRNRGTLGGSLCHADPSAQMPLCAVTLGAKLHAVGLNGVRAISAEDFFLSSYATALESIEMLVEVEFPDCQGALSALAQHVRRHGDSVTLSVAVVGRVDAEGRWTGVRVGLGGLADRPIVARRVAQFLEGSRLDEDTIRAASALVTDEIDPPSDVRASAEYRRHLAPQYVRQALLMLRERQQTPA